MFVVSELELALVNEEAAGLTDQIALVPPRASGQKGMLRLEALNFITGLPE